MDGLFRTVLLTMAAAALALGTGCDGQESYEGGGEADGAASEGTRDAEAAGGSGASVAPAGGEGGEAGEDSGEVTGVDALAHEMRLIDGTPRDLGEYRGKVVLLVNVASECGLTPQYEGLQALYEAKREEGLVVLGFPANNFGGQEPGSNAEIEAFCTGNYGVTFPMFEKISVVGEGVHPLYKELGAGLGEPTWNFTKYVVDREGRAVQRFDPRVSPDSPELVGAIDRLLSEG